MNRPFEDRVPQGYYDRAMNARGIQSTWHRQKFERVREAMGGFERHLDIACGPGTFISMLGGERSVGVDLATAQLAYASRTHGGSGSRWIACAADALPFAPDSFDVVTSIELIEHISEEAALTMLETAREVLRDGGRLVLTTPNFRSPWLLLEPLVSVLGEVDYRIEHITRYDRTSLHSLLERAGFRDVTVTRFQLAGPFLAPFGQRLADGAARYGTLGLEARMGCLLLAEAQK
ncbi:MAG: class I SAM-dependent methyltransferase [Geminicoccaceae bacterium]|nr:class I SAM-dependent methyltransferase [Geminicoccaceae bacterium]